MTADTSNLNASDDKDFELKEDIRLLGRLLGDTVRQQEGDHVFELIETIRQLSVQFYRDNDAPSKQSLEQVLADLTPEQAVLVVRAFSYFSHLANLAEDQHHIRRSRIHEILGDNPRPGSLANAFVHLADVGISGSVVRDFFKSALVSPVLTAHPTEVRRKSTMRHEMEVARLLDKRGREHLTPSETIEIDQQLSRSVLTVWQTNILRQSKMDVRDEVENGLSYYDYTFLREIPKFYADLEDRLDQLNADRAGEAVNSFLRMGSWIGGDRDGHPFVNALIS